ncbi:MAG: tetratricopeptide repeat protein, partial [Planctomycetota bacterium]
TPGDRTNREDFIEILARANRVEQAIKQTRSLIERFPEDSELQIKIARLHHQSNSEDRTEEIAKALNQFLESNGNDESSYLRVARLYQRFDDKKRATQTFDSCLKAFPQSETAQEYFADFLYKNEQKDRALRIWTRLADGAKRQTVTRIARQLSVRQEHQAAFEMLVSRYDDFKSNSVFLGLLCSESIAIKKPEQAIPWVLKRVQLAESNIDLEPGIAQAIQIITLANQIDQITDQLAGQKNRRWSTICLLAELYEVDGDSSQADSLLNTTAETLQANPLPDSNRQRNLLMMVIGQQIRLLIARQDFSAAAKTAEKLIQLPGGRRSNHIKNLIDLYVRDDQLEKTLPWLEEWKKVSPGSITPWLNHAEILDWMGKLDESIDILRMASQKFPEELEIQLQLGNRYIENGDYRDAQRIFWRNYEEASSLTDKLRWSERLAEVSEQLGVTEQLVEKFNERRKNNPQSIEPLLALAQVHRVADNYEERRKALSEATRIQPDNLPLLLEIARLEESEGDWERAVETLRSAEKLDKSNQTRERIALLYMQYGETERGYSMLLELAGGVQSGARDVEKIVDAIAQTEDWDLAEEFLQPHLDRFKDDYRILYQWAVIQEELEKTSVAKEQFIALLQHDTEVPGVKKNGNQGFGTAQIEMFKSILPKEAIELMRVGIASESAYGHQQNNNVPMFYRSSMTSSNQFIKLPDSIEMCHDMALVHLKSIYMDLDEELADELKTSIQDSGITNVEMMMGVTLNSYYSMMNEGQTLLDDYPDNETALAFTVMAMTNDRSIPAETAVTGYETFKQDYPELAFVAALNAAGIDKQHHDLLDAVLDQELKFTPSFVTLSAVSQFLGGEISDRQDFEHKLSSGQVTELNKRLLQWYPSMKSNNQWSPWIFMTIANAMKKDPDPKVWIRFLDQEIEKSKSKPQSSTNPWAQFRGRKSKENYVELLAFPPEEFISFPQMVLDRIATREGQEFYYYDLGFEAMPPEQWNEKYGPAIQHAEDPMLRALLTLRLASTSGGSDEAKRYDSLKKLIDEMLAADNPNPDSFLLAASLAVQTQNWDRASEILEKMRSLPMSRDMRMRVDGALVAVATEGIVSDLEAKENAKVTSSARSAALRLRRGRLSAKMRNQMVSVFETLGLTKEAESMENKIAQSGNLNFGNSNNSYGMSFGSSSRNQPPNRIREMIDTGKTDAAIRLIISQFKSQSSQSFDINSIYYSDHQLEELIRQTKSWGVKEEFIAKLNPGSSTSAIKWANYALALELFDKKDQAIEAYKNVLSSSSRQEGARFRQLLLEMENGVDISHHLPKFSPASIQAIVGFASSLVHSEMASVETIFSLFDRINQFAVDSDHQKIDLSWMPSIVRQLSNQWMIGRQGDSLPSMIVSDQSSMDELLEDISDKKLFEKLLVQRAKLHRKICQSMLSIPQLAPSGFTAMLQVAEANGEKDLAKFLPLATQAIVDFELPKRRNQSPYSTSSYSYGSGEEDLVPERTPLEFIARQFGLNSSPDRTELQSIKAELSEAGKDEQVNQLTRLIQLYDAADQNFVELSKSYLERPEKRNRRKTAFAIQNRLQKVIEIWADTKSTTDLDQLLLDQIKSESSSINVYGYSVGAKGAATVDYLGELARRKQMDRIETFVDELAIHWMGPPEKHAKLIEKWNKQQGGAFPNSKAGRFAGFLYNLVEEKQLVLFCGKLCKKYGVSLDLGDQLATAISDFENADKLIDWLDEGSPFLNDLDTFDPYLEVTKGSNKTVWSNALSQLNYRSIECEEELRKRLKIDKELRFGEELFLNIACAEYNSKCPSPFDILGKRLDEFQNLPSQRQKDVACMFIELKNSDMLRYSNISPVSTANGKLAEQLINSLMGDSIASNINLLREAKRLSDLPTDSYDAEDWILKTLQNLDRSDHEQWASLFFHMFLTPYIY